MLDVVVVGAGLAGALAALELRRRGGRVLVARRAWGATALSSGALALAHSPAAEAGKAVSVAGHVRDIAVHWPRHPYGVLGAGRVVPALIRGSALLSEALLQADLVLGRVDVESDNRLLASSLGTLVPAASALRSQWELDLGAMPGGVVGVVQLSGHAELDAGRVARGLLRDTQARGGSLDFRPVSVELDGRQTAILLARSFDDLSLVDQLASALERKKPGFDAFILPPVLGLSRHQEAWDLLRRRVGLPMVEALAHHPSPPGVRLQLALQRALAQAGIGTVEEVGAPKSEGKRVVSLTTVDGRELAAAAFVLATGRFVGGGVVWDESCHESLFGLPAESELGPLDGDSPEQALAAQPSAHHPLMHAGVRVDADLRPLAGGEPVFENLFAAGMVVGGFGSGTSSCAEGVAIATGALAAESVLSSLS